MNSGNLVERSENILIFPNNYALEICFLATIKHSKSHSILETCLPDLNKASEISCLSKTTHQWDDDKISNYLVVVLCVKFRVSDNFAYIIKTLRSIFQA